MDVMQAIYKRRATRGFTTVAVAAKILEELVAAAIQAPSAVNAQPWHFTIIRRPALLDRISAAAKVHMLKTLDRGSAPNEISQHLDNPNFHIFYHAPTVMLISAKGGDWAVEDAALAAENLMLAACAQGLGTCWIGFAQRWLETAEGRRAIELDAEYQPIAPIAVGYPCEPAPPVPRKSPILRWID
jgi:nitroreductase